MEELTFILGLELDLNLDLDLDVNFKETWNSIGEDQQNLLLKGLFQYLKVVCDHSDFHQRIYSMLLGIFQNLILEPKNPAWKFFQQFILDRTLLDSGRNNAIWIILGLIGHLDGQPLHQELVFDCIYSLFKNMTTGVQLDQVSLNISFYEHLDVDSAVKQTGMGLFALLGFNMPLLWPICCRQLQRLMNEDGEILKAVKLLIGLFDFRHSYAFMKESTQECADLVANIIEAGNNMEHEPMSIYINWIRQAYMRDHDNKGDQE